MTTCRTRIMHFFPKYWAFNLSWHEKPARRISSCTMPTGLLTTPGMANHDGSHQRLWGGIEEAFR